jgi:hypothetical protein
VFLFRDVDIEQVIEERDCLQSVFTAHKGASANGLYTCGVTPAMLIWNSHSRRVV